LSPPLLPPPLFSYLNLHVNITKPKVKYRFQAAAILLLYELNNTKSITAYLPIFYTIHNFRFLLEEYLVLLTWALLLSQDVVADQIFTVTIAVVLWQVILDTLHIKWEQGFFPSHKFINLTCCY
jgi:hypothetical protein